MERDRVIDLRSDTVTQPTEAMRQAMARAEVGDSYYGEDPTVRALEERAAELLGKEAGLLVTSGTMGNLVCLLTHVGRGDAVIVEESAHIFHNENGGLAALAGALPVRLKGHRGALDPVQVERAVYGEAVLHPRTRLICLENTHNMAGGTCLAVEQMRAVRAVADRHGLAVHVDGARIFNAAVALGVAPAALAEDADSLTFCLSKGLSCPFGSLIVGDEDFIAEARRNRQLVGGGMRQAGIMAAAGLVALETMIDRLAEDHENAQLLARGLVQLGLEVDLEAVQTNIVYFTVPEERGSASAEALVRRVNGRGVRVNPPRAGRVRLVTHHGVTREDVQRALEVFKEALA